MIPFSWTDDKFAKAKDLWIEGKSAREIAAGIADPGQAHPTRNAIIGKIHRSGLRTEDRKASPPQVNVRYGAPARPKAGKTAFAHGFKRPKLKLVVAGNGTVIVPGEARAARIEVREVTADIAINARPWITRQNGRECAWPVSGEGADTLSCCNPTNGKTYCPTHTQVMTGSMPKSWAGYSQPAFAKAVA